jgi:hypothetical protein
VLVRLLEAYMREVFESPWYGTAEALSRDSFGREFETQVAANVRVKRVDSDVTMIRTYGAHERVSVRPVTAEEEGKP